MLENLFYRHALHKKNADRWILLKKMTTGGSAIGIEEKKQLLVSPNCRSQDVIDERANLAPYFSLIGAILSRLASHLLASPGVYNQTIEISDEFWNKEFFPKGVLSEKGRKSFHSGIKESVAIALSQGLAIAQIDVPSARFENKAQQSALKADEPYVIIRDRDDLWDWDCDSEGFTYVKLHSYRLKRDSWKANLIPEHEFTIYERDKTGVYLSRYLVRPKRPEDYKNGVFAIASISEQNADVILDLDRTEVFYLEDGNSKKAIIPVCVLEFDSSLCIADQLYDSQRSHFNQTAAIEWALLSTNYAQLVFSDVEDEDLLKERITKTGDGYYWGLPQDVKVSWLERGGQGIDRAMEYRDAKKSEMLEVISQIAVTAASAYSQISRSGESKKEDRRNMDILLEVYGQSISDYIKNILDICAIARGSNTEWTVEGFSDYDSDGLLESLSQYEASSKAINSETFRRASQNQIVEKAIEELNLDPSLKNAIVEEMEASNFALSDRQLDFLQDLCNIGRLSNRGLLEIVQKLGILPADFDIDAELERNAIVDLGNAIEI